MKRHPNELDILIMKILSEMSDYSPESDEYDKRLRQLERLYALKADTRPPRVSRDTIAMAAANLAGILLIVAYEQKNVLSSKAFGWRINKN